MYDYVDVASQDMTNHEVCFLPEPSAAYRLYWSDTPDYRIEESHYICKISGDSRSFEFGLPGDRRIYFQLVDEGDPEQVIICGQRVLPVKGMLNFRDLGGYRAAEGKHIKWGILYRSDYFCKLEDESLPYVRSLGIRTIIDYRQPKEIKEHPNRDIASINILNCNPKAQVAEVAAKLQYLGDGERHTGGELPDMRKITGDGAMIRQQREFVTDENCKHAFSLALRVMAEEDYLPIDQHCRGGKDRTGYGVLLLLGILGVDERLILRDYMITKAVRLERNKHLYEKFSRQYQQKELVDFYYAMVDIKEEFLQASLDEIHKAYPSIEAYAKAELGITDGMVASMRNRYLE